MAIVHDLHPALHKVSAPIAFKEEHVACICTSEPACVQEVDYKAHIEVAYKM